jgi:hypothetical protein
VWGVIKVFVFVNDLGLVWFCLGIYI